MGRNFIILSVVAFLFSIAASAKTLAYEYARVPRKLLTSQIIKSLELIEDHGSTDELAFVYVPAQNLNALSFATNGWITTLRAQDVAEGKINRVSLMSNSMTEMIPIEPYHTYATLTDELGQIARNFSDLVTLESAGKSVQGRNLWYLRITAKQVVDEHKPKLLYVSSMHGDEVTGKEMMVYLIRYMLSEYRNGNSRIQNLLNHNELFLMPSMNPDGTELKQRWNANDMDLNRNFSNAYDAKIRGNEEPETKALIALHEAHHFVASLNFHGGELCINIPWDYRPNDNPLLRFGDDAAMQSLAQTYAKNNVPMYQHHEGEFNHGVIYGYEWFQVLGGMQDWSNVFHDSIHATVEISETKWPPAAELPDFWNDNRESMLQYLEEATRGIHLEVVDASGAPLNTEVSLSSSTRTIRFRDGIAHRASAPEPQEVLLESGILNPKVLRLTPWKYDGKLLKVVFSP